MGSNILKAAKTFIISYQTKNQEETWFRAVGGAATKDLENAHSYSNIGRAMIVARREFSPHLGRAISSWEVRSKEDHECLFTQHDKTKNTKRISMVWGFKRKNK